MEKNIDFDKFFVKSDLIPAIIQEKSTGEVLMLAYMNKESMKRPLKQDTHGFGQEAVRSFGTRALHRDIFKK